MEQFILEGNLADEHLPRDPTLRSIGCIPMKPEATLGKSAIMCAAELYTCVQLALLRMYSYIRVCVCVRRQYLSFSRQCAYLRLRMHTRHANMYDADGKRGMGQMVWVCVCAITSSKLLGNPTSTWCDIAFFTYPREKSLVTAKNFRGNCRFRGNVRVPPRRQKTQGRLASHRRELETRSPIRSSNVRI